MQGGKDGINECVSSRACRGRDEKGLGTFSIGRGVIRRIMEIVGNLGEGKKRRGRGNAGAAMVYGPMQCREGKAQRFAQLNGEG